MRLSVEGPVQFALRSTPPIAAAIGIAVALLAGTKSAVGFAIGVGLSVASLWSGSWAVRSTVHAQASKIAAISRLQLILLFKLPVFAAVAFYANSLGLRPLCYFLAGYLLVYFALTVGAILRGSAPATSE